MKKLQHGNDTEDNMENVKTGFRQNVKKCDFGCAATSPEKRISARMESESASLEHVSDAVFGTGISMFSHRKDFLKSDVIFTPGLSLESAHSVEFLCRTGSVHTIAGTGFDDDSPDPIVFTGETFKVNETVFEREFHAADPDFLALVDSLDHGNGAYKRTDVTPGTDLSVKNSRGRKRIEKKAEHYREALDAEACLIFRYPSEGPMGFRIKDSSGVDTPVVFRGSEIRHLRKIFRKGMIYYGEVPSVGILEFLSLKPLPKRRLASFVLFPPRDDSGEFILSFFNSGNLSGNDVRNLGNLLMEPRKKQNI